MTTILNLSRTTYEQINYVKGDAMLFYIQWKKSDGGDADENTGFTWNFDFTNGNKVLFTLTPVFVNNSLMKFQPTPLQVKQLAAANYFIRGICKDANGAATTKATILLNVFTPYQGANPVDNSYTLTLTDITAPLVSNKLATPTITLSTITDTTIDGSSSIITHATAYLFQRSDDNGVTWQDISATDNTFSNTGLTPETLYKYRAKVSGDGYTDSDYSAVVSGTTQSSIDINSYFDYVIEANGSLGFADGLPTDQIANVHEEVGQLNVTKGNWTMPYLGRGSYNARFDPPLIMDLKIPLRVSTGGIDGVAFPNIPSPYYNMPDDQGRPGEINPFIGTPREVWGVKIKLIGQTDEEQEGGGDNAGLIGNNNGNVRIVNAQYGRLPNTVRPPYYIIYVERIVIPDETQATYWRNNVEYDTLDFQSPDLNNYIKKTSTIGVTSNSDEWIFIAQFVKDGTFNDSDRDIIYNALVAKYNVGNKPQEILLNSITIAVNGGVITPTLSIDNQLPVSRTMADPSTWIYDYYQDDGSLQIQKKLTTTGVAANVNQMSVGDGDYVKCAVTPLDTEGNYFCKLEGTYTQVRNL